MQWEYYGIHFLYSKSYNMVQMGDFYLLFVLGRRHIIIGKKIHFDSSFEFDFDFELNLLVPENNYLHNNTYLYTYTYNVNLFNVT